MRRLILKSFQSPGDIVMLTAAVRDLHRAHPGRFQTDVRSAAEALWHENKYIVPLKEGDSGVELIDMHYPLIHESNQRPYHFIHGYAQYLEQKLGVPVPISEFRGHVKLSDEEKQLPCPGAEFGVPERFWIVVAGGKYDFTAKWWKPENFQRVVDHFHGRITFVQCGEAGHWHPPLKGVVNLIGKTTLRDFVRLMYHADGVLCPVTFAMHLAAAVETPAGRPGRRACVVIAGGREPSHWEAYPHHQFISTNGMLSCCSDGGCWKSRCQKVGDGDKKDFEDLCVSPVEVTPGLSIPRCMDMVTVDDVVRRIEMYYDGGLLTYGNADQTLADSVARANLLPSAVDADAARVEPDGGTANRIDVSFYHGLGDCAYFSHMIPLYRRRGFDIGVECTDDKSLLFEAAGARVLGQGEAIDSHAWGYPPGGTFEGHGDYWIGSKIGHNLSQPPLPDIGAKQDLWQELISGQTQIERLIPADDRATIRRWLSRLARPITLFHSKGNSGQERKSLPDRVASEFYREFLDQCLGTLILLDWDRRVPRLSSARVRHLDDLGTCSTARMFALMLEADLLIGVDSGPLHAATLTEIPSIGLWMPGHYPATYTLPRKNQLNVVLRDHTQQWNRFKRIPWRIVEHEGSQFQGNRLADFCRQMQGKPRYLTDDKAADAQLQQFILEWCRCRGTSGLADYWDRNRSFDVLFREISARFTTPLIVETGTIRAEEDWGGAGFFTYLAGCYLFRHGGNLHSVDITPQHCAFARRWTEQFGESVSIHEQDSLAFLGNFKQQIDVLYLDSLDTTEPHHAQHAMAEFQTAEPLLNEQSIVVVDDSPWNAGAFTGKGAMVIRHLLDRNWHILYAGYQVLLSRVPRKTADDGLLMRI